MVPSSRFHSAKSSVVVDATTAATVWFYFTTPVTESTMALTPSNDDVSVPRAFDVCAGDYRKLDIDHLAHPRPSSQTHGFSEVREVVLPVKRHKLTTCVAQMLCLMSSYGTPSTQVHGTAAISFRDMLTQARPKRRSA